MTHVDSVSVTIATVVPGLFPLLLVGFKGQLCGIAGERPDGSYISTVSI